MNHVTEKGESEEKPTLHVPRWYRRWWRRIRHRPIRRAWNYLVHGTVLCRGFVFCSFTLGDPDGFVRDSSGPTEIVRIQPPNPGGTWRCADVDLVQEWWLESDDDRIRGFSQTAYVSCVYCSDI